MAASASVGAGTRHVAELAKSGRSTCKAKACGQKIAQGELRMGKGYERDEHLMMSWYHVACWPVPKALACLGDIEGWEALTSDQKQAIIARAPNRAPKDDAPPSVAAPILVNAPPVDAPPVDAPPADGAARTGTSDLAAFSALCARLEAAGGSLDKSAIIQRHLARVPSSEDRFLTVRLLLPGKREHDLRVYNLKDKSLITHLARALRCSEDDMSAHFESSADVGLTAAHCANVGIEGERPTHASRIPRAHAPRTRTPQSPPRPPIRPRRSRP